MTQLCLIKIFQNVWQARFAWWLPKISAQMDTLDEALKTLAPRAELEARWKATDDRLVAIGNELSDLPQQPILDDKTST